MRVQGQPAALAVLVDLGGDGAIAGLQLADVTVDVLKTQAESALEGETLN